MTLRFLTIVTGGKLTSQTEMKTQKEVQEILWGGEICWGYYKLEIVI